MRLYKKLIFLGVFIVLITGTSITGVASKISSGETKLDVCDSAYSIIYTDDEYYIMDFDGMCLKRNKADNIKEIFEYRNSTYLVNVILDGDTERWQLWELNVDAYGIDKEKEDFKLVYDDAYAIFETFTVGIVNVQMREDHIYDICFDMDEEKTVIALDMSGFKEYGDFRNLKQMDVRGEKLYFLTIAGELIEYDIKKQEFKKVTEEFVYSIRKEIDY